MGAGQAIQLDLAQKNAMQFLSPMVGDVLDKLGDQFAGQQGGICLLLALRGLVPDFGGWPSNTSIRQPTLSRWHFATLSPGRTDAQFCQEIEWWKQEKTSHSHQIFLGRDSHPEATASPTRQMQCRSAARNDLRTSSGTGRDHNHLDLFTRIALKRIER